MKTKATARMPQPGPAKKLSRKKAKKKFKKIKSQGESGTPGSRLAAVAVRPPKAPENFSQNWKALQEVRLATGPLHPGLSVGSTDPEGGRMLWLVPKRGGRTTPHCTDSFTVISTSRHGSRAVVAV